MATVNASIRSHRAISMRYLLQPKQQKNIKQKYSSAGKQSRVETDIKLQDRMMRPAMHWLDQIPRLFWPFGWILRAKWLESLMKNHHWWLEDSRRQKNEISPYFPQPASTSLLA
jgi:hypothetical protein